MSFLPTVEVYLVVNTGTFSDPATLLGAGGGALLSVAVGTTAPLIFRFIVNSS